MNASLTSAVANLTREEKLQLIDGLWESLGASLNEIDMPATHEAELKRREQRIADGQATFSDWDEARKRLFSAAKK